MGNCAEVRFDNDSDNHVVYLHWHGGPESVLAFLEALRERGWTRMDYASARFVSVVSEFLDAAGNDTGLSVGIFDNYTGAGDDNGLYFVTSIDPVRVSQRRATLFSSDFAQDATYRATIEMLRTSRRLRKMLALGVGSSGKSEQAEEGKRIRLVTEKTVCAPLREIVRLERVQVLPRVYKNQEHLECGHAGLIREGFYALTSAKKRRCIECQHEIADKLNKKEE